METKGYLRVSIANVLTLYHKIFFWTAFSDYFFQYRLIPFTDAWEPEMGLGNILAITGESSLRRVLTLEEASANKYGEQ